MESPKSILFVCMGNICRSPAAEGVMTQLVRNAGLTDHYHLDSAGTIDYHAGAPADSRMRAAASKRGYSLDSRSRPVVPQDMDTFDLIIAMDTENRDFLFRMAAGTENESKIHMMSEFARRSSFREVPDPYYGGAQGFDEVLDLLEDACAGLLERTQPRE
jgi:protein-tyrosine phosphatase